MTLAPGTRFGVYEILLLIGSGGMGEVYRARDSRLNRDVAIKVLPSDLAADPDRLARFEREAQVLGSLNHPNIAHIYGVDDSSGTPALVMELVEGPTLADRIAKGPIPLDDALPIAKQIAEALEAAHEQGIIHRDLKPANIKVRADGTVKVLDFGLAKAFDPVASAAGNATMSPTLSIHATQAGLILGTAAYMAPEQVRGKAVDRRADIWAFGCVLYEMLTGKRPFEGDEISTTLAAVLKTEPEWSALSAAAQPSLRRLLGRCLCKDPKDRLRDIGEARIEIDDVLSGAVDESGSSATVGRAQGWRRTIAVAGIVLVIATATGTIGWFVARSTVARPRVLRFAITPPNAAALSLSSVTRDVVLTPDGSRLIYVGANGTTLFIRPLDQLEALPLVHGGALHDPFVSPDGQWVGFFEGFTVLKKVAITGGPAVLVTAVDSTERGATWAADGAIIVATATGLKRVGADGGEPVVLTQPDRARGESSHILPERLPGGQAILYTVYATTGGIDASSIAVLDLRSGRSRILLRGGTHAQYAPSGHLVYAAAGTLRAVGFDPARLTIVGESTQVVPHVARVLVGAVAVEASLARDGTLVYVSGGTQGTEVRTLVWVDRQGRETPITAPPRAYQFPRVAPDGTRVAVTIFDQNADIWVWELGRETLTRVTSVGSRNLSPVWMDGRRLVFGSNLAGGSNLYTQAADGNGAAERLTESPNPQMPSAVSPDGTRLVFSTLSPTTTDDVMALQLDGPHKAVPLVQTPFIERNGVVSPDGHWLAYEANDSGSFEIYVRPFPDVSRERRQVSTNGGTQPLWSPAGQELFYVAPDNALMRVTLASKATWTASTPTKVLEGRYVMGTLPTTPFRNYDIAPDGRRFLMVKAAASDAAAVPPEIIVVQHFDEELKRLVPTK
jgi:serine/threonine-protein kinase